MAAQKINFAMLQPGDLVAARFNFSTTTNKGFTDYAAILVVQNGVLNEQLSWIWIAAGKYEKCHASYKDFSNAFKIYSIDE